jgi:gephyrin
LQPGKPLTFATVKSPNSNREKLIFALPGNPVSSLVTFYVFVLISLRKLAGYTNPSLPVVNVTTTTPVTLDPERVDYHRVKISWDSSKSCFVATSTGMQF